MTSEDYAKLQKQMLKLEQESDILKKVKGHIRKKVKDTEITNFINSQKNNYTVQIMCEILNIPRSTYYLSLNKTMSDRERENNELTEQIFKIHKDSKKLYGAPKIYLELRKVRLYSKL